jgi:hypothetical protein
MFVLVQTAQAAAAGTQARVDATQPHAREISQASAQFDPAGRPFRAAPRASPQHPGGWQA